MAFPEPPSIEAIESMNASDESSQAPETGSQAPERAQDSAGDATSAQEVAQQLYELEKLEKFKFQGQEMTAKELERAIMRQKDYTQKTQKFSEERKAYETSQKEEQKFYKNLSWDIKAVIENPQLASDFIRVYPEKFHADLRDALNQAQAQQQNQQQHQTQGRQDGLSPQQFEMMSRLQALEKRDHESNVQRRANEIDKTVKTLSEKYPDALPEVAIGRAYEAHNSGVELTQEVWERIYKDADASMKSLVSQRYGKLVKTQSEVNAKSRADDAGGGTVGKAPVKPKSFKEATAFAMQEMLRKN